MCIFLIKYNSVYMYCIYVVYVLYICCIYVVYVLYMYYTYVVYIHILILQENLVNYYWIIRRLRRIFIFAIGPFSLFLTIMF